MTNTVSSAWRFANGMLMVFDEHGEQIVELQGEATVERLEAIRARSEPQTEWHGFGEDGALSWR